MDPHISIITLGVRDLEKATAFYRDGLGLPVKSQQGDIIFFNFGDLQFGLYPRKKLAEDATVDEKGEGFGGITLAHNVATNEEVRQILREAEAAGGQIVKPPQVAIWGGYSGYFADLDGQLWEVACVDNIEDETQSKSEENP